MRGARSLRSSTKRGKAIDRVSIRNPGRRTRTVYAAVGFDSDKRVELFNTSYVLRAR